MGLSGQSMGAVIVGTCIPRKMMVLGLDLQKLEILSRDLVMGSITYLLEANGQGRRGPMSQPT